MTYFGYKTLERSYLLKTDKGHIVERPQYLLMRVALGIHCGRPCHDDSDNRAPLSSVSKEEEDANLQAAI